MQRATSILPTAGNMLAQAQQQRGMATLKQISMRLKSVKNIQKITQSMKMVSAAKYTRAERELKQARPLEGGKQFYEKAECVAPEASKKLYIAITSDRGKLKVFKLPARLFNGFTSRFVRSLPHRRRPSNPRRVDQRPEHSRHLRRRQKPRRVAALVRQEHYLGGTGGEFIQRGPSPALN